MDSNSTWAQRIAEDYTKCDKQSCEDCLAYVTPYKRDKPLCLVFIVEECNDSLKRKIENVLYN